MKHFPSNEDIQCTLTNCSNDRIQCYVDSFHNERKGQCHIYTYPHQMTFYDGISNHFPGGVFQHVQHAMLFDERPFDHNFFLRIAQAFPFLKDLTVKNFQEQNRNFNNDNRHLSIIEYPSLINLCLKQVHDDYAEQFLLNDKTFFSDHICLMIDFSTLQRVTYNFTRDVTRLNCTKIKRIHLSNRLNLSNHFYTYFPSFKNESLF